MKNMRNQDATTKYQGSYRATIEQAIKDAGADIESLDKQIAELKRQRDAAEADRKRLSELARKSWGK